jgi:Tol biopolymer transport system component/DNA-binding winged helix-turn-helix (wHTH) protein
MSVKLFRFGLFELNPATRQLHKQGGQVRLQEQPLRVLEILLERPGELVTRQELRQRLWPSDIYVDFELGLNGAIKRLRLALGDSADNPRFVETVPKSGYRFIAPVQTVAAPAEPAAKDVAMDLLPAVAGQAGGLAVQTAPEAMPVPRIIQPPRRRAAYRIAALVVVAVAIVVYLSRPETTPPQITRIAKLTNSGQAWPQESLMSDGARLYYTEHTVANGFRLRQILLNGNEDTIVTGLPANSLIRGLSPDHTMFLGIAQAAAEQDRPAPPWVVPVVGGPSRRVGNFPTNDVAWSPDGSSLAFGKDNQLCIANVDGSGEHVLATAPGRVFYPRWSPDGQVLRFSVLDVKGQVAIWETTIDGSNLHAMQFDWPGSPMEGFGEWTPDGRYFLFASQREGVSNLWAVQEKDKAGWLHRPRPEPVQLTAGPMNYYRPLPSSDGKRIFALGTQFAGELVRYDAGRREFVPFLGGLSGDHLDFTRDGRWVTYVAYPEATLWRARSDGSQRLQLTSPPMRAFAPRWSPDGTRILFTNRQPGRLPKVYTISFDGGTPEPLVSESHAQTGGSWSPDGTSILYGRDPDGENQDIALYRFDLRTRHTERIPGTEGLYCLLWSPDGRRVAASSTAASRLLVLLDLKTGTITPLSKHKADYPAWSADSQYIYFNSNVAPQPAIFRVHVADRREEKVTDVAFRATGTYGSWSGLAPDGSPLLLRDRKQTDVYALSLALH